MPNFGDNTLPKASVIAELVAYSSMPTAIVRTFTGDAFVVAADGRVCNSKTGAVTDEDMQKIFRLGNEQLACSFTGAANLGRADRDDNDEVLFSFIEHLRSSAQAVSARRCTTLQKYGERLSRRVQSALEEALRLGNIELPDTLPEPPEPGATIVDIYIDGYFAGHPSRVRIRFWHDRQMLGEPSVTTQELMPMVNASHGIPEIARRLSRHDSALLHYLRPVELENPYSDAITTAIRYSRGFIEACAGPEGMAANPQASATINDRVHIAVITAKDGFHWLPGFSPNRPK